MFCRKCGQELSKGSLFCNKCGCEVGLEIDQNQCVEHEILDINISENAEESDFVKKADEQVNKRVKGFSKVTIISITLIALMFCIIWYDSYSSTRLNEARTLYLSKEYYDAFKKVDNLLYFGEERREAQKIKLGGNLGSYYQFYKNEMVPQYDWLTVDYERAVRLLFDGLDFIKVEEKIASNDWKKDIINDFKEKYYSELNNRFNVSRTIVDNILGLNFDEKEKKIASIASRTEGEEEKTAFNQNNPIEFKNLDWDSNSLYTIATGQAYNRSNKTVRFVTIKVSFKNREGNVIDTDSTYAVGSEGLAPGEATKWRASVKRDKNIESYSVSVIDFRY